MTFAVALAFVPLALAFTPLPLGHHCHPIRSIPQHTAMSLDEELRRDVESMRVKQIKEELEKLGVAHNDAFEKDDLVQRLLDARGEQHEDEPQAPPSMDQTMDGMDMVMADEDGVKVMEEIQQNPKLMEAAMDIAANGFSDKYADDAEVMTFMKRLEAISKRQSS